MSRGHRYSFPILFGVKYVLWAYSFAFKVDFLEDMYDFLDFIRSFVCYSLSLQRTIVEHSMIASFTVQNYLSFRQPVSFSFEPTSDSFMSDEYTIEVKEGVRLLKIGIIYGANASGKTNLIFALNALRNIMCFSSEDKMKGIDIVPFLLDSESSKQHTMFELSFYVGGEKYLLQMEVDNKRIYREKLAFYPSIKSALLYDRTYNQEENLVEIKWGAYLKFSKKSTLAIEGNTIPNTSVMAAWSKSNVETSRLDDIYRFFSEQMFLPLSSSDPLASYAREALRNDDEGRIKSFVKTFLQASDFNISDIEIEDEEMPISEEVRNLFLSLPMTEGSRFEWLKEGIMHKEQFVFSHHTKHGDYKLPEVLESSGTFQMLILSVLLYKMLNGESITIIDEIESSLHYELLSYFIRTFIASSEKPSQLLFTTHDLNLLNEDYLRRDTIWFAQKDEEGVSQLTRLSSYGLHKRVSPYNAYRQNKLAPLPFLGSQYIDINVD